MRGFLFYIIGACIITLALAKYDKSNKSTNTDWVVLGFAGFLIFLGGIMFSILPAET